MQAGGKRIMIAMSNEHRNANTGQTRARVAQGELRAQTAIFQVVRVASDDKEIGTLPFAQRRQPIERDECGLAQSSDEFCRSLPGDARKSRVQMQIGSMYKTYGLHENFTLSEAFLPSDSIPGLGADHSRLQRREFRVLRQNFLSLFNVRGGPARFASFYQSLADDAGRWRLE